MIGDIVKDLNEVLQGLVALLMLVSSLVGIAASLYLKAKANEADLGDFLGAVKEAELEIRDSVKAGLVKDLDEAVESGMDLVKKMNRGRKLPKHLAERARTRIRRVVKPLLPPPEKS